MNKGIYPVLSGGIAQERRLEILTNNLANVNTVGYKKDVPVFAVEEPGGLSHPHPAGIPESEQSFVGMDGFFTDYSPGVTRQTGNSLDFAIEGSGFFVVESPEGTRYSRNGSFTLSPDRQLVTAEGWPVVGDNGPILLTENGKIAVDGDGSISINGSEVNRFRIVDFEKPYGLKKEAGSLFSGEGEIEAAGHRILQGTLEISNVQGLKEMTSMIEVMRAYESYQKAMQSLDDLGQKANEIGRVG
jgi:flagellar basal-body rod protein FlgG